MGLFRKKKAPEHIALSGKGKAKEVGQALAYVMGVENLYVFCQEESEKTQEILAVLKQYCPNVLENAYPEGQRGCVMVFGDSDYYASVVKEGVDAPVVFWQTSFLDACKLLPQGVEMPYITIYDPNFYTPGSEAFTEGLVHLVQLGICLDAGLFDMVYSSFSLEKLVKRVTTMMVEVEEAVRDGSNAREYLTFGEPITTALAQVGNGELSQGEAMALGMLWTARCGVRAGRFPHQLYQDLDGVLSYLGLPRDYEVDGEEMKKAILGDREVAENITLYLPWKKGACVPFETTYETLFRLLEKTK